MESEIFLDSMRRNTTYYPNANNFVVYLRSPLRNVYQVDIVSAIFPRLTYDNNVLVDIQELRNNKLKAVYSLNQYAYFGGASGSSGVTSPGESVSRSFGVISSAAHTINSNVVYNENTNYKISSTFRTPLDYIDKFTVNWRDQTGNLIPIGDNTILLRVKHDC